METTEKILKDLIKTLGDLYAEQLNAMPIKKPVREALIDGFRAGVNVGVRHTVKMLDVKVNES